MNFGMRGHDIACESIEAVAKGAASKNIKVIQLAMRKSMGDIDWHTGMFNIGLAEHIKRTLSDADVRVGVLGCYVNLLAEGDELEANLASLRDTILYAKHIGAGCVGLESGDAGDPEATHSYASLRKFIDRIKPVIEYAQKLSVAIAIEPVSVHTLCTPERVKAFLNEINYPNLYIIFDMVNALTVEYAKDQHAFLDKCFNLYGDRIAVIHIKDFVIEDGVKKDVVAGMGELDFKYFFKKVQAEKPYIDMILDGMADLDTIDSLRSQLNSFLRNE